MSTSLRLDRILGREVHTVDRRRVGRLEEFRAVRADDTWVIHEYIIGTAGLIERLGMGVRLILGLKAVGGYVARWDQVDLSDPEHPTLTCPVEELERD
jgi:hypothetical protein